MSKIAKLNIEEKLPIIKTLIENDEAEIKPNVITVYSIIKCFNVSYIEAIILLNQYVLNEQDLSNYAIFFLCETVDDTGNIYSKKIISSCDKDVNNILEDTKHTLGYGVFAICNLNEYYLMEDYTPFIGENELITRFDFSNVPQNYFSSLNEPKDNNINNNNKKESKIKEKSIKKKEKEREKSKSKEKKQTKKSNIISEKEEENYFGNFQPAKKAKTDKDKINLGGGGRENLKRKKRDTDDDKSEREKIKEKYHKKGKFKEDEDKKSNISSDNNLEDIKEENKDEDIQMKDCTNGDKSKNEPKKIKKIRKVKKTKTYFNEEGYMVTKDEEVEEEYWSDEKPEKKIVKHNYVSHDNKNNKKKKTNKGQTTISSFFAK